MSRGGHVRGAPFGTRAVRVLHRADGLVAGRGRDSLAPRPRAGQPKARPLTTLRARLRAGARAAHAFRQRPTTGDRSPSGTVSGPWGAGADSAYGKKINAEARTQRSSYGRTGAHGGGSVTGGARLDLGSFDPLRLRRSAWKRVRRGTSLNSTVPEVHRLVFRPVMSDVGA
jgi:hypothetical protein